MGTASSTKQPGKKGKGPGKKKRFSMKKLLIGSIIAAIIGVICALGVYMVIIMNGAKIVEENIDKFDTAETTLIFDSDEKEVAKLFRENRESVAIKDVPENLKNAFIATEDRRFESHAGIDFWSIGRALVKDVMHMSAVEGGSTITQQLAKNVFLSSEKTAFRKATEVSIAIALENKYDKDEILEKYLNRIYFGSNAYGVKAAAKVYFGKSDLSQLKLWEMATLAALPKAPSRYSPLSSPDKSKERRAVVLQLMKDQGYITESERAEAAAVDYVAPKGSGSKQYATFIDYVVQEAEDVYQIDEDELLTKGYRIHTTMNTKAQQTVETTYANPAFFQKDAADGQKIQSSMVIIDHKTGGLMALIGGRDYQTKGLNRIFSQRQPGSSFKPIIAYGPALESGDWTPYSKLDDTQTSFGNGTYSPRNYDRTTHGQVTMFEAVKKSYNLAPVWLLEQIGVSKGRDFAKKLGITLDPKKDNNLAIALGGLTNGVSPLEMATAYTAFANQGVQIKPHAILKIQDGDGRDVAVYKQEKKQVIQPKTAWYLTLLLQGVVEPGGTGVKAKFDRPVAGKTGTTGLDLKGIEKYDRDVWFVGYTPEWTAAVWEGFDRTDSKHYVTVGSGSTAAIFKEVMSKSLAGRPVTAFAKPEGVADLTEPPTGVADLAAVYVPETKSVKLTWTPLDDTKVAYQVYRQTAQQPEGQLLIQSPTAEVSDTTVSSGEAYHYYVVPLNTETAIPGDKSNVVDIQIPADEALPGGTSPSPTPGEPGSDASPTPTPSASPGNKPGGKPSPTPHKPDGGPGASPSPSPSPPAQGDPKPGDHKPPGGDQPAGNRGGPADGDALDFLNEPMQQ
ncbi:PBP1A family penicillin-binding protein [Paenibacillus athensensis]|uniref:Uncharacterized protein n=1 Tax=Paenibacillus athensensis TaxID=1967502 RepID=A0A4Y8Q762_9BACL|nr:PBP1A family penicillin-binding protein [Paenibacillus athensensis]MCD1257350.1 PBP1A family penicillin-binding protein [Paenibacillus athensensis]